MVENKLPLSGYFTSLLRLLTGVCRWSRTHSAQSSLAQSRHFDLASCWLPDNALHMSHCGNLCQHVTNHLLLRPPLELVGRMKRRQCVDLSVRPSVRPFVSRVFSVRGAVSKAFDRGQQRLLPPKCKTSQSSIPHWSSFVKFGIIGYHNPCLFLPAGSHNTDLSCHVPIFTFCCTVRSQSTRSTVTDGNTACLQLHYSNMLRKTTTTFIN